MAEDDEKKGDEGVPVLTRKLLDLTSKY